MEPWDPEASYLAMLKHGKKAWQEHASVRVGGDGDADVNASFTTDSCLALAMKRSDVKERAL